MLVVLVIHLILLLLLAMSYLPRPVKNLIEAFQRLPGIGSKTAARLTFYLLDHPQKDIEDFAQSLVNLKKQTVTCSNCFNIADLDPCQICSDPERDQSLICVVEQPLDLIALESAGNFKGVYHVLHGGIDPLNNIGPDEIKIYELMARIKKGTITEIILATNPTMEGEATAIYISNEIKKLNGVSVKITRLAHGLPVGADVEFADAITLSRAIEGRREM